MSPAKPGDTIVIVANTEKMGTNLVFLKAEIRHKEKNSIIASGTHTKFVGGQ
jgi:acyl-coenzyme A thioesterase 13